jgi:hypothetical protein
MKNTCRLLPIMGCLQLTSMLCCGQLLAADGALLKAAVAPTVALYPSSNAAPLSAG